MANRQQLLMPDEQSTRDRVRALVREVLNNALPADEVDNDASPPASAAPSSPSAPAQSPTSARVITTVPPAPAATDEPPIARDESAKPVITETDVRGLEPG